MGTGSLLRPEIDEPQVCVTVRGREYIATRARLGGFLRLQYALLDISKAAKTQDTGPLVDAIFSFLQTAIGITPDDFANASWVEVATAYHAAANLNHLPDAEQFAMMKYAEVVKPVPWDYPARTMIVWLHYFAEAYGWTKDRVLELWPEEAVALLQEIEASDLAQREFEHMHSELAYKFDRRGKGTYQPLTKPFWMVYRKNRTITRMTRRSLPVGVVVYRPGEGPEVVEEAKT